MARERALATENASGEAISLTRCDSQQGNDMLASEEMCLSTVEEESAGDTMLCGYLWC